MACWKVSCANARLGTPSPATWHHGPLHRSTHRHGKSRAPDTEKAPPPPLAKDDGERALQAGINKAVATCSQNLHKIYLQIFVNPSHMMSSDLISSILKKQKTSISSPLLGPIRWTRSCKPLETLSFTCQPMVSWLRLAAILWWAIKGYKSLSDQAYYSAYSAWNRVKPKVLILLQYHYCLFCCSTNRIAVDYCGWFLTKGVQKRAYRMFRIEVLLTKVHSSHLQSTSQFFQQENWIPIATVKAHHNKFASDKL